MNGTSAGAACRAVNDGQGPSSGHTRPGTPGLLVDVAQEAGAVDPHPLGEQLAVLIEDATALAMSLNGSALFVHATGHSSS